MKQEMKAKAAALAKQEAEAREQERIRAEEQALLIEQAKEAERMRAEEEMHRIRATALAVTPPSMCGVVSCLCASLLSLCISWTNRSFELLSAA